MATRRGPAPKLETEVARPDNKVLRDATERLKSAIVKVYTMGGKLGPVYGEAVRSVMYCEDKGMSRRDISQVIADAWTNGRKGRNVSKGVGARYFVLARRQRQGKPVIVEGVKYKSVLAALESGRVLFTSVYLAVQGRRRSRARGTDTNLGNTIKRWKIGGKSVATDLRAFVVAWKALMQTPIALEITDEKSRASMLATLTQAPSIGARTRNHLRKVEPVAQAA